MSKDAEKLNCTFNQLDPVDITERFINRGRNVLKLRRNIHQATELGHFLNYKTYLNEVKSQKSYVCPQTIELL